MIELDKLIEAVEAGGYDATPDRAARFNDFSEAWEAARGAYTQPSYTAAWNAYNGSLDAALALHEALLPGWAPGMSKNVHHGYWFAWVQTKDRQAEAVEPTPARAWLLAVLRAYRSVQA